MLGRRNWVDNTTPFNTIVLERQLGGAMAWKWAVEPQKEQQACVSNVQVCVSHHENIYMLVQEQILIFIFHQFW